MKPFSARLVNPEYVALHAPTGLYMINVGSINDFRQQDLNRQLNTDEILVLLTFHAINLQKKEDKRQLLKTKLRI